MSDNKPIARISVRRKEGDAWKSYSVVTVWSTKHDGLYNVSLDRGNDKYPAMGLLDAIKALAAGASWSISTPKGSSAPVRNDPFSGGAFDDQEPPF